MGRDAHGPDRHFGRHGIDLQLPRQRTSAENWTGLFTPGERVRLRIINVSAMTNFNLRLPGMPITVVQCDGQHAQPVETDEFQIGIAETFDVVVQPNEANAYSLIVEAIDRSGWYARHWRRAWGWRRRLCHCGKGPCWG